MIKTNLNPMARRTKIPYTKRATTLQQQITLLKSHGVQIADEDKAHEYLSDIGYYRLGFYIYPFEQTYPFLDHRRSHNVLPGTTIEDIVAFYYYDLDLRNILNRYLSRIEVALRTTIIYELSNRYPSNPWWYVDPTIVDASFITTFTSRFYGNIKDKDPIKRHHHRYQEPYASSTSCSGKYPSTAHATCGTRYTKPPIPSTPKPQASNHS